MFRRFKNREIKKVGDKMYVEKFDKTKVGECPFCGEPVFANEGQIITYYKEQPTHKVCRKKEKKYLKYIKEEMR